MGKRIHIAVLSGGLVVAIAILGGATSSHPHSFRTYSSSIPILQLPLKISLDHPLVVANVEVDSATAALFKPKFADIVGRVFVDRPFSSIIYFVPTDAGTYLLETRSFVGEPIDTLGLSGQWIVDTGVETSYQTTVCTDGTVTVVDTINTTPLNPASSDAILDTDTTRVHMTRYQLLNTGHFVPVADSIYLVR